MYVFLHRVVDPEMRADVGHIGVEPIGERSELIRRCCVLGSVRKRISRLLKRRLARLGGLEQILRLLCVLTQAFQTGNLAFDFLDAVIPGVDEPPCPTLEGGGVFLTVDQALGVVFEAHDMRCGIAPLTLVKAGLLTSTSFTLRLPVLKTL
jgi:hypothetical protein